MKNRRLAQLVRVGTFCTATVASTACVSNSGIQRIEDGHYRATAHASDSHRAEMRALSASYAYCKKLKLGTVFDDPRKDETINEDGSGATVNMTFQCATVPAPCTESGITFDC